MTLQVIPHFAALPRWPQFHNKYILTSKMFKEKLFTISARICPYSWPSSSCRSLKSPTCMCFKKINIFPVSLISIWLSSPAWYFWFLINKHETTLLPHAYLVFPFFYCLAFLTEILIITLKAVKSSLVAVSKKQRYPEWTSIDVCRLLLLSSLDIRLLPCRFLTPLIFAFSCFQKWRSR